MSGYDPQTYWDTLLSSSFDLRAVGWPNLSLAFNRWQYRARVAALRRLIPDARELRVLDVGAGTGFWVAYWHAMGAASVSGIDLSKVSVDQLRKRFPGDEFVQADITRAVPIFGGVDVVSAIDVLLHITADEEYGRALANLRKVSRTGSRLVTIEPIAYGRPIPFRAGASSRARELEKVRRLMADAGWQLETVSPAMWLLSSPVELRPAPVCVALGIWWRVIARIARSEVGGSVVGGLVYPIDRLLTRLRWGPTAKVTLAVAF